MTPGEGDGDETFEEDSEVYDEVLGDIAEWVLPRIRVPWCEHGCTYHDREARGGVFVCRAPYAFVLLRRTGVEVPLCLWLSSGSALYSYSLCSGPVQLCSPWSQLVVIEVKSADGTKISVIPFKHNDMWHSLCIKRLLLQQENQDKKLYDSCFCIPVIKWTVWMGLMWRFGSDPIYWLMTVTDIN